MPVSVLTIDLTDSPSNDTSLPPIKEVTSSAPQAPIRRLVERSLMQEKAGHYGVLAEAIDLATPARVREVLKIVCGTLEAFERASAYLLATRDEVPSENQDSDDDDDGSDSAIEKRGAKNALKRKTTRDEQDIYCVRYMTCENCNEEFDVTDNGAEDCVWHEGEKELDDESSTWDDHDDNCHGDRRYLEDEPDYEDGYMWSCCEEPGSAEGCKKTKHKSPSTTNKRIRK